MATYSIEETATEIEKRLINIVGSEYFTFEINEKEFKIRVSDHSANHLNNKFDETVISFVTSKESNCNRRMCAEYLINDGYSEEYMTIEECLDFEL